LWIELDCYEALTHTPHWYWYIIHRQW
jgi:hypothetical protein